MTNPEHLPTRNFNVDKAKERLWQLLEEFSINFRNNPIINATLRNEFDELFGIKDMPASALVDYIFLPYITTGHGNRQAGLHVYYRAGEHPTEVGSICLFEFGKNLDSYDNEINFYVEDYEILETFCESLKVLGMKCNESSFNFKLTVDGGYELSECDGCEDLSMFKQYSENVFKGFIERKTILGLFESSIGDDELVNRVILKPVFRGETDESGYGTVLIEVYLDGKIAHTLSMGIGKNIDGKVDTVTFDPEFESVIRRANPALPPDSQILFVMAKRLTDNLQLF